MSYNDYIKTLNFVRENASTDFQDRIPEATRDNIALIGNAVTESPQTANEFLTVLINKLAFTLIDRAGAENPLAMFQGRTINFGDHIEDIFVEIPKGTEFDPADENPYAIVKPTIQTLYHVVDRKMVYTVTVSDQQLKLAFTGPETMSEFISNIVGTLQDAMTDDAFTYAKTLLSNEDNYGLVLDLGSATQQEIVTKLYAQMRLVASNMKFMRTDYNALGVRTRTPADRLAFVIRNDIRQAIDLQVLAGIFNLDKVVIQEKIIEIDSFDDVEVLAVVVDTKGLRIHNALKTAESQRNGKALYTNYFAHSWDLLSFAKFYNAVMFKGVVTEDSPFNLTVTSNGYGYGDVGMVTLDQIDTASKLLSLTFPLLNENTPFDIDGDFLDGTEAAVVYLNYPSAAGFQSIYLSTLAGLESALSDYSTDRTSGLIFGSLNVQFIEP